jgi:phosphate starvation-inducible membrane PsiE
MAIFPIKLQTYTHRTALIVALIRNHSKEKRKMIVDTAILMIMALAKKVGTSLFRRNIKLLSLAHT